MRPKWPKLASLAQKICTFYFQFFDAFFASKGYPFKNIFNNYNQHKYIYRYMHNNTSPSSIRLLVGRIFFLVRKRKSDCIYEYIIGLKTLLRQGKPELVTFVRKPVFLTYSRKIIKHNKIVGYKRAIIQQFIYQAVNPITVYSYMRNVFFLRTRQWVRI